MFVWAMSSGRETEIGGFRMVLGAGEEVFLSCGESSGR